ncbi:MAG: DUF1499 domain-containing protein [Candidatus Latescibacterota bacterium]
MKALWVLAGVVLLIIIIGIMWARTASRPELGIHNDKLLPLPNLPNCVATQSGDTTQRMEPIHYVTDREEAHTKLLHIINQMPRTTLIQSEPEYIHIVFRSAFFGFPDDVEFQFTDNKIHFRAAARLGHSDLGVNRKRMENIKQLFKK